MIRRPLVRPGGQVGRTGKERERSYVAVVQGKWTLKTKGRAWCTEKRVEQRKNYWFLDKRGARVGAQKRWRR